MELDEKSYSLDSGEAHPKIVITPARTVLHSGFNRRVCLGCTNEMKTRIEECRGLLYAKGTNIKNRSYTLSETII